MPTPDRTTIKAAFDELISKLRANLVASPPTASKPFRQIEVAASGVDEYPRPFLSVQIGRVRPLGTMDGDKLIEVSSSLGVVVDTGAGDPSAALLDSVGAVDDYLDSTIDVGLHAGAEGFDDRVWSFDYPKSTSGRRVATASATQSFVVKVERQQNRVPKP